MSSAIGLDPGARLLDAATTDIERRVAWLRLPIIALAIAGGTISPSRSSTGALLAAILLSLLFAALALFWVYRRSVTPAFAAYTTAVDVCVLTVLVGASGGPFSEARWAFLALPTIVAFRLQPVLTAGAGAATLVAYGIQSLAADGGLGEDATQIVAFCGYLTWAGGAATLLTFALRRRTERVGELIAARQRLTSEALEAEERERRSLAEGLHNETVQNLLAARHDLQEVSDEAPHPALDRADAALVTTIEQVREAIFELHPYVLEEAGLRAALTSIAEHAARRGGFRIELSIDYDDGHPHERLLLTAAREILANAAEHARARHVSLRLGRDRDQVVMVIEDDGQGFSPSVLPARAAQGHIGIPSQRTRVRSVGGVLELTSRPGFGTSVEIRLPT